MANNTAKTPDVDLVSRHIRVIDGNICVSSKELMRILGVTTRTLSLWEGKGCPKAGRGFWDLASVLEWRGLTKAGLKNADKAENNSAMSDKLAAESKLKAAQAAAAEFKTDQLMGKYLDRAFVIDELRTFFTVFKKSTQAMGRSIAMEVGQYLEPKEARRLEKRLNEQLNDILLQLSVEGVYEAKKQESRTGRKQV